MPAVPGGGRQTGRPPWLSFYGILFSSLTALSVMGAVESAVSGPSRKELLADRALAESVSGPC